MGTSGYKKGAQRAAYSYMTSLVPGTIRTIEQVAKATGETHPRAGRALAQLTEDNKLERVGVALHRYNGSDLPKVPEPVQASTPGYSKGDCFEVVGLTSDQRVVVSDGDNRLWVLQAL